MEWNDLAEQLTGLSHIATADAHGQPHVAKALPAIIDDTVWFFTWKSSKKARNIAINPKVSMMWDPAAESYVRGTAELVDDPERKAWLWNSGHLSYDPAGFFGSSDDPDVVAVKVTPTAAVVMTEDASGSRRVRWTR